MHSRGAFGLWSEAQVSRVAFPTVQSLWLVFNRQKSKVAAVLKWPVHYIVVMQCLLSIETSVCFASKHFILLHRFASFFPCPIVELEPVPWQQLLSTSVLTASTLHRGLPVACIWKRVCKLSVVCNHLRKKKTTEKPYLQQQIQVTHLCSRDLFRHVPSKKEGCGHLW